MSNNKFKRAKDKRTKGQLSVHLSIDINITYIKRLGEEIQS